MGRWIGLGLGLGVLVWGLSGCAARQQTLKHATAGHVGCPADEIAIYDAVGNGSWKAVCRGEVYICSAVGTGYAVQVSCSVMQGPSAARMRRAEQTASVTRGFNEKANISFVRADFKLPGAELRVIGAPQVELGRLVFTVSGGTYSPAAKCDNLDVLVNGKPTSAAMGAIKGERGRFSVEGSLEFSVFKPLASQFPEFSVRMCSETWNFTGEQVAQLRKFLVMYSELAQEVQAAETPAATSQTF